MTTAETIACTNCESALALNSKYCSQCGAPAQIIETRSEHRKVLPLLVLFYILEVIVCSYVSVYNEDATLKMCLIADSIMAFYAICFFVSIWHDVKQILKWQNFSIIKVFTYVTLAILGSLVVQLGVSWMNKSIFDQESYFFPAFAEYQYPLLTMLAFTALSPALFEELAYRGFVLGGLMKILDARQSIFISSFLFALIHFNLLSFLWIFPFALFLGYIRKKENTIWYGVLVHLVFNSLACLYEYYDLKLWIDSLF